MDQQSKPAMVTPKSWMKLRILGRGYTSTRSAMTPDRRALRSGQAIDRFLFDGTAILA
jgi:hypothetical protein